MNWNIALPIAVVYALYRYGKKSGSLNDSYTWEGHLEAQLYSYCLFKSLYVPRGTETLWERGWIAQPTSVTGFNDFLLFLDEAIESKPKYIAALDAKMKEQRDKDSATQDYVQQFIANFQQDWSKSPLELGIVREMRVSNHYMSMANVQNAIGDGSFVPYVHKNTIETLNIPGAFNLEHILIRGIKTDQIGLDWYLRNPNRIFLDNGAFKQNEKLSFAEVIAYYRGLLDYVKNSKRGQNLRQSNIMKGELYPKLLMVAPDAFQDAKGTLQLLKRFHPLVKKHLRFNDVVFAIQTDDRGFAANDTAGVDAMLDYAKTFMTHAIIGIPTSSSRQKVRSKSLLPYILSYTEDHFPTTTEQFLYQDGINQIISYTQPGHAPIALPKTRLFKVHMLGSSYGKYYREVLENICVSLYLIKIRGLRLRKFSREHMKAWAEIPHAIQRNILCGAPGRGNVAPYVLKHLVSTDSSSWIRTMTIGKNLYSPYTSSQLVIRRNHPFLWAQNKGIKFLLSMLNSKISECLDNRYYDWDPSVAAEQEQAEKRFVQECMKKGWEKG